ncbi:flavodoxin family protein [Methanobacterium alcaliphilum]|uniref:flavodoxin family protein n=1 Tax=Methanobacterium alcaliphilum TaxID=392018 RepID=UPI00200A8BED|nr:NAD(P)H-dependent oxidoreductase [Methanobacterium alcaliphilum]MCK9151396.1 NAD(P)H-dependent oxidoreductase [Methanobacterium alcaliphilum]
MKIGIIVYSQTENTYAVSQKLQEKFAEVGHDVEVERVLTAGEVPPRAKNAEFQSKPDVEVYDALVFGAPVHAFSLAAPMKLYLEQIESLNGKKVACFVTKGLRFNWTGGNQAIGKMKKICQTKGGTVVGTDIIVWNKNKDQQIDDLIRKFSLLF